MSILNEPDHVIREHLSEVIQKVDWEGGWASFAVYCGGSHETGFSELDQAVEELYLANEKVHRIANALCIKYGVEW